MSNNQSNFLNKLEIRQLKNVKDLVMSFNENRKVVAIFGENGCGKSTILHALACVYQQPNAQGDYQAGEQYKFTNFFPPTSLGQWNGSELEICYYENGQAKSRLYKKGDRWTRYEDRPRREVYFLGVSMCVPQIETENKTSQIKIEQDANSAFKSRVINDINIVLNRNYNTISFSNKGKYKLAEINSISYPSIFMGAGEKKVIEILRILHSAGKDSLILIDELDLTLHTSALKKIIDIMLRIAEEKNLQIIFTTHREDIIKFNSIKDKIDIRFITNRLSKNKTECLNNITSEGFLELTGEEEVKRYLYVEDTMSESIVKQFLIENNILSNSEIIKYGAIDNAFTIACGLYLSQEEIFNKCLFILDGDKYTSQDEKLAQIRNKLSGTEADIEQKRQRVLERMIQFNSNKKKSPETIIHETILGLNEDCIEKNELEKIARYHTSGDNHALLPKDSQLRLLIIKKFSQQIDIWESYTSELTQKLLCKKE